MKVTKRLHEIEIKRFEFSNKDAQGMCFLRARAQDNDLILLCGQLIHYSGISVTNASETILKDAIHHLRKCIVLDGFVMSGPWWKLFNRKDPTFTHKFEKIHDSYFLTVLWSKDVVSRTKLIEYYPPIWSIGLPQKESYAIKIFTGSLLAPEEDKNTLHISKDDVAEICKVDNDFLTIDEKELIL